MKRIGIITYHAAYNFGSVLQAYATQRAVEELGNEATIINYQPKTQIDYYKRMYRYKISPKFFIKDLSLLPVHGARKIRAQKYDSFIATEMHLTEKMYTTTAELDEVRDTFDVYVSGSDQIINKHSNELESDDWPAMDPYLLSFTKRKKISYASSPASMTQEEIERIAPALREFDALSAREHDAAEMMKRAVGKKVDNVVDPTLLLDDGVWRSVASRCKTIFPDKYAVYYTLDGTNKVWGRRKTLKVLAKQLGFPILVVTPFAFLPSDEELQGCHDFGPLDFLKAIDNASLVITDSYHGTLFSINFGVPFLSISDGSASSRRKDQILEKVSLENHIVRELDESILRAAEADWNVAATKSRLYELRDKSLAYLSDSL